MVKRRTKLLNYICLKSKTPKNGQILTLTKIISVLLLFKKYLVIYYLFKNQIRETQFLPVTQVYENQVS